ncbi:hypothetical protein PoB_002321700 [Plakobranchus ocellatus]|uniref:Uncharacterized protein n=1 Tax=Plakobranchus ocellatus TaxID=259542 RepID=A0AAV3ZQF0_9GAST|nr:hypothetical protein PoB_002321700 [Plakobranchus ocellatus]
MMEEGEEEARRAKTNRKRRRMTRRRIRNKGKKYARRCGRMREKGGRKKRGEMKDPRQGDLKLSGPLSSQSTGVRAQTCNRKVPVDLRMDLLSTVPLAPPWRRRKNRLQRKKRQG